MDVESVVRADTLICDRCGIAPREITVLGRDLCGMCYCRYASELVRSSKPPANPRPRPTKTGAKPQ